MSITLIGTTFDARDAAAAATFWAGALGRPLGDGATPEQAAVEADPAVPGSRIGFRRVPEGKTVKNRVHFDFVTADFDAEVARLAALGATKLQETDAGFRYATLADPEGNEFDVIAR
jgi:predicted enzyme related to lactoylglutathione lyase